MNRFAVYNILVNLAPIVLNYHLRWCGKPAEKNFKYFTVVFEDEGSQNWCFCLKQFQLLST